MWTLHDEMQFQINVRQKYTLENNGNVLKI